MKHGSGLPKMKHSSRRRFRLHKPFFSWYRGLLQKTPATTVFLEYVFQLNPGRYICLMIEVPSD